MGGLCGNSAFSAAFRLRPSVKESGCAEGQLCAYIHVLVGQ